MPRPCVVNLDSLATIRRSVLGSRITTLGSARMQDVERAMHLALGVPLPCRTT
jgi:mRNA-degrading endonuclease toxin of MazEF toxin-antitoxin module